LAAGNSFMWGDDWLKREFPSLYRRQLLPERGKRVDEQPIHEFES
jgi:hypothetical protein